MDKGSFAVGETVYHYNLGKCVITEFHGKNWLDIEEYFVEFPDGTSIYVIAEELSRSVKSDKIRKLCECGAWATDFPNFHSDWCPLYKRNLF